MRIDHKNDIDPSPSRGQVPVLCSELVRHSHDIHHLLTKIGPVSNHYVIGHIEAHLEKIDDSIADLKVEYQIPESPQQSMPLIEQDDRPLTTTQGLRLFLKSVRNLGAKVQKTLKAQGSQVNRKASNPLADLSRKLNNDRVRTAYFLQ